jgi:rod shape-determining protein MreD
VKSALLLPGLLLAALFALLLEQSPAPPPWLPGHEWVLLPVILALATFLLPPAALWCLAFTAGLLTDLVSQSRLGSTALVALVTALALHAALPASVRTRWYAQAAASFIATLLFQSLAFLTFCLHQGRFLLGSTLVPHTLAAATLNAALLPAILAAAQLASALPALRTPARATRPTRPARRRHAR